VTVLLKMERDAPCTTSNIQDPPLRESCCTALTSGPILELGEIGGCTCPYFNPTIVALDDLSCATPAEILLDGETETISGAMHRPPLAA
jgi:hypothetical protein